MTERPSPRERLNARTPGEWVEGVMAGTILPRDLAEIIAVAFTAAVMTAIGADNALVQRIGAPIPSNQSAREDQIARSLGVSRDTLRRAVHGKRWLRLDEIGASLHDPVIGRHFQAELERFGFDARVLHTVADLRMGPVPGMGGWIMGTNNQTLGEASMHDLALIEARVRDDLRRLASIQEIARRRGDSVGTARWGALYRAATAKNSPPPGSGSRSRILEANIENLALLIRQIMARQSETRAYVIVDEISRDHPKTNKKEIRDSINGMLRHGRIIAVERGVYRLPRPEEV